MNITNKDKTKEEKVKREKENEKNAKIFTIIQGIAKNISMSSEVETFKIINLNLHKELAEFLSDGIKSNKTLKILNINSCNFTNESYEILAKSILEHEKIEFIELVNIQLTDKSGNMISRIIARQTQRRDQVVWMYGLRNERPTNSDYTKGLLSINLSNNMLSDTSAEDIANALSHDFYIRSINLSSNEINEEGCKKFIRVMRKNLTLVNLDLRDNPGYTDNIHKRLVIKLSKNIKYLVSNPDNIYTKNEVDYFKAFVNSEYFTHVEIPQEGMYILITI